MEIIITDDTKALGKAAGNAAAAIIRQAIAARGQANIIMATGTSQFETLNEIIAAKDINWGKVVMFHLDEYIGLSVSAKASFRKYLQERFLDQVPPLKAAYLIDGEADPDAECVRLATLIAEHPIDLCMSGIGENGHLAFNDPPADFDTEAPYIVVNLDDACRNQQFGEGWFNTFDEVPRQAISMSVKQILRSKHIIGSVPDRRKAEAARNCFKNPVSNLFPASILQTHDQCVFYFDTEAASLLNL